MALDDKSQFALSWKRVGIAIGAAGVLLVVLMLLNGSAEGGAADMAAVVAVVFRIALFAAIVVGVIWAVRRGTAQGIRDAKQQSQTPPAIPADRFKVTGADEQTGEDTVYFVSAVTAEDAATQARQRGTLVAEIRKL